MSTAIRSRAMFQCGKIEASSSNTDIQTPYHARKVSAQIKFTSSSTGNFHLASYARFQQLNHNIPSISTSCPSSRQLPPLHLNTSPVTIFKINSFCVKTSRQHPDPRSRVSTSPVRSQQLYSPTSQPRTHHHFLLHQLTPPAAAAYYPDLHPNFLRSPLLPIMQCSDFFQISRSNGPKEKAARHVYHFSEKLNWAEVDCHRYDFMAVVGGGSS